MNTSNVNLLYAKKEKNDEFYTKYEDIESTCTKYSQYFEDKTIYCNCDTLDSNFFKYFQNNFFRFKLRRLIATSYTPIGRGVFLEHDGVITNYKMLNSHGNFQSAECIKKLKQADIVITNPPFSLFKEYIEQLITENKQFLIVGSQNATIYNSVFKQIKDNKLFIHQGFKSNVGFFLSNYPNRAGLRNIQQEGCIRVPGVIWYTNLPTQSNPHLSLTQKYTPEAYPHYDNYNAINVDKITDIPKDYDGPMGVPITFLYNYNPNQFSIIGKAANLKIGDKTKYQRIIIKNNLAETNNQTQKPTKITTNTSLHKAKKERNDEFYTTYEDIEKEIKHYDISHFKGKTVYCNTDDYTHSNFVSYFQNNFFRLGLKRLISVGYKSNSKGVFMTYDGFSFDCKELVGDGDFRSSESLKILEQTDIVVSNPPFSLFREYVAQLMQYNKQFLIIGNQNAISNMEIFPLIKNNKMWLGINLCKNFIQPNGIKKRIGNACWYTNIQHNKRNKTMKLYKQYTPEAYPHYDNYNAIDVSQIKAIPTDYDGVMGVPITFLNKYYPDQFEIVDFRKGTDGKDLCIDGKSPYCRVLIKYKKTTK